MLKSNPKKIISWLKVNYGVFVLAFLVLGTLGEKSRTILWINFFLDVVICAVSLALNVMLFLSKREISLPLKVFLLLITLLLAAFTYYAFIMPECGMPPALFS
ncbi:MAG: hypothetical protein NC319_09915 [Butyricicoccus sp.]|nr:hypothetical protein [Butyricicoccus sp.]